MSNLWKFITKFLTYQRLQLVKHDDLIKSINDGIQDTAHGTCRMDLGALSSQFIFALSQSICETPVHIGTVVSL